MEPLRRRGWRNSDVVIFCIRLAIGAISIYALFYFNLINFDVLIDVTKSPGYLAAAFLCLLITPLLGAIRWLYLLRAVGFRPTLGWTINITFISLFFNIFLPGSHGGDLVRIGMAYSAAGSRLNRITVSVIVDRLSGVVALLALGAAMLAWLPVQYWELVTIAALILVFGLVAGVAVALIWGQQIAALLLKLPKPFGPILAHICTEIATALQQYVSNVRVLIIAFVISVLQYLLAIASLIMIGLAMKFMSLPISGYGIAGIWAMLANALPLSPGGLGVGEAAFVHVATLLETVKSGASYASVFLVMRVLTVIVGLGGIVPLMIYRNDVRTGMRNTGIADGGAQIVHEDRTANQEQRCSEPA